MTKQEKVTNIIFQLRKAKGITQQELASEIGVTRQTIISIEKGVYTPSLILALKISKYFNLALEQIFTYEK